MATKYVNSGASGANDGTSWTDAWTSLSSATGVSAGDLVLVHKAHSQTYTTATTLTFSNGTNANPVKIICVDKDASDALSTGATIAQTTSGGFTLTGAVEIDGLTFTSSTGTAPVFSGTTGLIQRHRNCTYTLTGSVGITFCTSNGAAALLFNPTISLAGTSSSNAAIGLGANGGTLHVRGGSITWRSAAATTIGFTANVLGGRVILEGVDLSTNNLTSIASVTTGGCFHAKRCKLGTYTNLVNATPTNPETHAWALLEGCVSGTISVPSLGLTWLENRAGTAKSSLSRYRTGGADDPSGEQANAHSWELGSSANTLEQYSWLESPPLQRWLDNSGSQTIRIYFASGATLNDDDIWPEVLSPNETASPNTTSQGRYQSGRLANQGTPAAWTTDSGSTWTGTGTGTKQYMDITVNPAEAGPIEIRICLAKPSTTVYVDPQVAIP